MTSLEWAFWFILVALGHTYLTFPLSLPFLVELFGRKRPWNYSDKLPKLSILISAYNEEAVIARKLQNCLELDYPAELLEIMVGDDGSSDRTAEIVSSFAPRVTLVKAKQNAGKASMLNQLHKEATGDVLLFCDANTMFLPNVARKIVQPFVDERIGCVCGRLVLMDSSGSTLGVGEAAYWDLESEIKKFEGMLDIVIGGNGALYAIRKDLYTPLPVRRSIMDDFFITVQVLQKGFLSTYLSSAIGSEQTSKEGTGEFRRKVRIGRANFNYLHHYLPLLNPLRPLVAYCFLSHKLLRWFSPHLLIGLVVVNAILLTHGWFYVATFSLEMLLLLLGLLGWWQSKLGRKSRLTFAPFYLGTMNFALLLGFFQSFLPQRGGGWKREARGDEFVSLI